MLLSRSWRGLLDKAGLGSGHGAKNRRTPRRLGVESLETRRLMSVAPSSPAALGDPAQNGPPVAQDDVYTMRGNRQLGADVMANDSDPDGDALTVALVDGTSHGKLVLGADGRFAYTPDRNFSGADRFTYQVSDGQALSRIATVDVTVEVAPQNAAPIGQADSYRTSEDQVLTVDRPGVLSNDTNGDQGPLDAILVAGPRNGTLVLGADGSFDYTPNAGFSGEDGFVYKASNGMDTSEPVAVTIAVDPVNHPPTAIDDSYSVTQDQSLTMPASGVLANDTDAEGDPLTAAVVTGPGSGMLNLNADGSFVYTPNAGFVGADTFAYKANDGQLDSNVATVIITVNRANTAPTAVDQSYSVTQDQSLTMPASGVLANDTDAEGDPLTAAVVTGPGSGMLNLNADGSFVYTPNAGFVGADTFTYKANDGQLDSNVATVTITVNRANTAPTVVDDSYSVTQDQSLTMPASGVLANDTDAEGDPLIAAVVTGPGSGMLNLNADGSFVYTPNAGFVGADTFTYKANDGQADSNVATVTIAVNRANIAPTAVDDSYSVIQDQPLTVPANGVLANDTDAEGDPLTAAMVTGPASGTLNLNADGSFVYTPNAGFVGADTFTYKANDGQLDSNVATVTIAVNRANIAPTAVDDSYSVIQDQPLTLPANGVLANDTDAEGDPLTAAVVAGPASGTLSLNADGSFVYTPNAGFVGTDTFTYKANDGQADSNVATVTITVSPVTPPAKEMKIDLEVSGRPFGSDAGPVWGGSTFWVSAYVQDLRDGPQGVVGGAFDLQYDATSVTPTGRVVFGDQFTDYRQGAADPADGLIDEAGALTTQGGVGTETSARFVSWEFRRNGPGAPNDRNTHVTFTVDPSEGTGKITPGNFALVGLGAPIDWTNVEMGSVGLNLNLGDFNGNGLVNQCDLALWIPHAFSSEGDPRFDPQFDLNGDERINLSDLNLLMPRLYRSIDADPPALSDRPEGTVIHGRPIAAPHHFGPQLDLDWVGPSVGRPHGPVGPLARQLAVDALLARHWRHG